MLSEPLAILPLPSTTIIVLAFAVPNAKLPDPTTASIVNTLSFKLKVVFAPDCSL